ncbi:hypothetical protein B1A99_17360 [Cohnella sp. CIP 111063]|uniref:ABC transporter substrate-binding protein n=1 Tax=unclassified Cohnella TaxID=2636738 RepID=UPI000B8BD7EE|nr:MULTISPECIES: extracellular solute-binding protein [unclassified Cohnella]OXS57256.1 hypothetical protein B1A99_17360 [Cohnella sp. CIP 111063]PRX70695.1 multiple sugar transport system substrate-binding protein [Cohnella sp. SGD-V74]
MNHIGRIKSAILAFALVVAGCDGGSAPSGEWAPLGSEEEAAIRIGYWSEKQFNDDYGLMFRSKYPNVSFEVIGLDDLYSDPTLTAAQAYAKYIERHQPDVLYLGNTYRTLAQEGMLLELDPWIEKHKFDLDSYSPVSLALLRQEGDGKLYGLSPNFSSYGIFYNAKLFEKHGVMLPHNAMTWEELFELAKRFPTAGDDDSRLYGFTIDGYSSPLFDILYSLAGQNRKLVDASKSRLTVDGEQWRKPFEAIVDVFRSGSFRHPSPEELTRTMRTAGDNRFLAGQSAMTYSQSYLIRALSSSALDWGVVSAPVDGLDRSKSGSYSLDGVFAISKTTRNARAAWEFVQYVNSADFAQVTSRAGREVLYSRSEFIRPQEGRDISGLYSLEPLLHADESFASLPNPVQAKLTLAIVNELIAVIDHSKTLDEAIEAMLAEGEEILLQTNAEEKSG